MSIVFMSVLGVLAAVWVALIVRASRRRAAQERVEIGVVQARAVALLDAPRDSQPDRMQDEKRPVAGTTRETRDEWVRDRVDSGHCRYCEAAACHQFPTFTPVRPFFDSLLRYLNATANNRWKIEIERGTDVPYELCEKHHEQVLGYFEEQVAAERAEYTSFVAGQRLAMYEFERFAADERALEEMQALKRRKRIAGRDAPVIRMAPRRANGES
jgi:hypothetical protein